MQNKLNEILELCIEKSDKEKFYSFFYNPKWETLVIKKNYQVVYGNEPMELLLDQALEYMQNE